MSNSAWAKATPLYEIEVPKDTRLGWDPPAVEAPFLVALRVILGFAFFWLMLLSTDPPAQKWQAGITILVAIGLTLFSRNRRVQQPDRGQRLNDQDLQLHILKIQNALFKKHTALGARLSLGYDIGAKWMMFIGGWMFLPACIWGGTKWPFVAIAGALMELGSIAFADWLAGRWVTDFKKRITDGVCVNCEYSPGRSTEPLTPCPECGVILPIASQPPQIAEASHE